MPKIIDARGRSCPEPVIMTKKAMSTEDEGCEVLVDNRTAVQNILRFAKNGGYFAEARDEGNDFRIIINKTAGM